MLNCKNSTFFSKNSGKNLRISKNSSTFAPSNKNKQQLKTITIMKGTVKINREIRMNGKKYEHYWVIECAKEVKYICRDFNAKGVEFCPNGMPFRTLTAAKNFCNENGFNYVYIK